MKKKKKKKEKKKLIIHEINTLEMRAVPMRFYTAHVSYMSVCRVRAGTM